MKFITLPLYRLPTLLSETKDGFKALEGGFSSHLFPALLAQRLGADSEGARGPGPPCQIIRQL